MSRAGISAQDHELPEEWNELTHVIIGCAMEVHSVLGPGLVERLYEDAMAIELRERGLAFERQVPIRLRYKGVELSEQRLDLVVEGRVVVELKSVDAVPDIALAQLVSYLRSVSFQLGVLINFNVTRLKDDIYRRIHSVGRSHQGPSSRASPDAPLPSRSC